MKKHLTTIIIVSLICIASAFGAFLFSNKTSSLKTEIMALQQEVQSLEAQANRLNAPKPQDSLLANLDDLNGYFIGSDGALDFVEYIESLAVSSGLTYRINLFDAEQNPDLAKNDKEFIKASLSVSGSLRNVRNFISLIETLPYNVKITKIDLKRDGGVSVTAGARETWSLIIDFSAVKIMSK